MADGEIGDALLERQFYNPETFARLREQQR